MRELPAQDLPEDLQSEADGFAGDATAIVAMVVASIMLMTQARALITGQALPAATLSRLRQRFGAKRDRG